VHVAWTLRDDLRHGWFRPPTHHILRASIDGGQIRALDHEVASGDISCHFPELVPGRSFGVACEAYGGNAAPAAMEVRWE
jgi:hypothetical protein